MKTTQRHIKETALMDLNFEEIEKSESNIGLVFGSYKIFSDKDFMSKFHAKAPSVNWLGCTTAGEITNKGVFDDSLTVTLINFENPESKFKVAKAIISDMAGSKDAGAELGKQLSTPDLTGIILLSPGTNVNGSAVVEGLSEAVSKDVIITGGLAGDGGAFDRTLTLCDGEISDNMLVGIGLYGESLHLNHGCMGGWDAFGKDRKVTKSEANILFELDGQPALDIYKEYLGEHAERLPESGLMFPFSVVDENNKEGMGIIRTILAIDEEKGSLTLAGNIEQGCTVRLMHANTKGLVLGSEKAAKSSISSVGKKDSALALLVSCVGRKLVMGGNVDDEIEVVSESFGKDCVLTGFYSYGEISPFVDTVECKLHNQTMTISYIWENQI